MRLQQLRPVIVLLAILIGVLGLGVGITKQEPLRGPFSGRVVLPDGKPAAGAKVFLVETSLEPKVVQETQTDSEGKFSFTYEFKELEGEPKIAALADGAAIGYAGLAGWKNGSEIKLALPTELRLKVINPGGNAAARVRFAPALFVVNVALAEEEPSSGTRPIPDSFPRFIVLPKSLAEQFASETNEKGELAMRGLPQGVMVRLQALDTRFAQLPYETQLKLSNAEITNGSPIELKLGATFRGKVMYADGKPLENVRVNAQGSGPSPGFGTALTRTDGSFEIASMQEGTYNLGLDLKSGMAEDWTAIAFADVPVKQGAIKQGLDFKLIKGGLAVGRVTDLDGKPIAGMSVGIYGPARPRSGAWVQHALTDKDGCYRLRVPAGAQYIYLMGGPTGSPFNQMGKAIEVVDGKETKTDFEGVQIIKSD